MRGRSRPLEKDVREGTYGDEKGGARGAMGLWGMGF